MGLALCRPGGVPELDEPWAARRRLLTLGSIPASACGCRHWPGCFSGTKKCSLPSPPPDPLPFRFSHLRFRPATPDTSDMRRISHSEHIRRRCCMSGGSWHLRLSNASLSGCLIASPTLFSVYKNRPSVVSSRLFFPFLILIQQTIFGSVSQSSSVIHSLQSCARCSSLFPFTFIKHFELCSLFSNNFNLPTSILFGTPITTTTSINMKFTSIIVGALAAVATAAPAAPAVKDVEARASFDLGKLNNLAFLNSNFQYLNLINTLDLQLLAQLGTVNNFNILGFQSLFQSNAFDINALLQFQQLQMVLQLAQLGVFNGFDLSTLAFNSLNLGVINGIGGFDVNSLIDSSLTPQITNVINTGGVVVTKE